MWITYANPVPYPIPVPYAASTAYGGHRRRRAPAMVDHTSHQTHHPTGHHTGHETERRALLTPVVLLLLAERPGHGYELVQRLRAFGWPQAESAHVYRLLRSMESCGSIASRWRATGPGPARREYRLTPEGAGELAEWSGRLGELHTTLHVFLERCERLEPPAARTARPPDRRL
ncbi:MULTISPECIES: helix-turn-helix transcriptional regulator [Streptomyces]|uniref:Helix-turn-helix transcriptional regulator n=1 Tax=Streptomyces lichenis TaxID=2306967 RepID=A0ABT0I3Z2_9ACTN|nr:helix-turn-helix transcriptional regulator [Streptomyces lichenis]MCK8676045.1 helix-turn-helix transcriptional regulator [Streptomyces lichenis]